MNVVILEDEYLLALELEEKIKSIDPSIHIIAKLESLQQAHTWFSQHSCDLIFSDIQLGDGIAFNLFSQLQLSTPIIFVTAFNQYAIEAFEYNSIAYLLKPIEEKKLRLALEKHKELHQAQPDFEQLLRQLANPTTPKQSLYRQRFLLSMGNKIRPTNVDEIAYFEADNKYLFAMTVEQEKYFCDATLAQLEEELDPKLFFRVNRKYVVHINAVKELIPYSKSRIKIKISPETQEDIIISYAKSKEFKAWLTR